MSLTKGMQIRVTDSVKFVQINVMSAVRIVGDRAKEVQNSVTD